MYNDSDRVTIWRYDKNYMYHEDKDTIYFRSKGEYKDIAWFDKRTKILYENTKYKDRFKAAKSEIHKKLELNKDQISEYIDMV